MPGGSGGGTEAPEMLRKARRNGEGARDETEAETETEGESDSQPVGYATLAANGQTIN